MAILEFECVGNLQLAALGTSSVKMSPGQKLQIILGTNGSGKSAIIAEMTLMASKPAAYERGAGYKRVVEDIRGTVYESLSDFRGDKNHFLLKKNDEVLYSGHSSEAHTALVVQETGMTPDIHEIRIGKKKLSMMKVDERRKWFTKIAPEDYTYAIGYYSRLNDATRDISGTIKRLNLRLLSERAKLINPEDEIAMRAEIKELKEQKHEFMQHWRPMEDSVESILEKVYDIDAKLLDMSDRFSQSLKVFCNVKGYKSQQDIWDEISESQGKISYFSKLVNDLCEKIDTNRALLSQSQQLAGQDIEQIDRELADISRGIVSSALIMFSDDWKGISKEALTTYDLIYGQLMELMDELEEDPDLVYSPENHALRVKELERLTSLINHIMPQALEVSEQISLMEHRKLEGHTSCPKCEHTWSRGFDEEMYQALLLKRDKFDKRLSEATKSFEEITEVQKTSYEQLNLYQRIGNIAQISKILDPMWMELNRGKFIRTRPKTAIEYVKAVRTQITITMEYEDLQQAKAELTEKKKLALEVSGVNQSELLNSNTQMETRLFHYQQQVSELTALVTGLKKAQLAMDYQEKYIPTTDDLLMRRSEYLSKAEIANHHTAVNSVVMQLDSMISQKETMLNQIDQQHAIIKSLEEEVEGCTIKERAMKQALDALSPSKGLIAKGLTGSINHFIAQMNAIIEKVWLYPLAINPITITEDKGFKLDYNFGFSVNNEKAGSDVSQASGAQTEIFDLAHMLVSMVALGMDTTEIFLDEFSIKMDYAHRKEAVRMIMELLNSSNFSQIFMISHYESSYGAMSNADITVLCPNNIQIPEDLKYNQVSQVIKN